MENRLSSFTGIIVIATLVFGVIVMARGHEDWFINKQAFGKATQDVGELGARFGVPYSFTRSGKVIYSDGFEASLAPWTTVAGAGYGTVERCDEISFRGAYSVKLTPAIDGVQSAQIIKTIPYIMSGKIGLEVVFAGEPAADQAQITIAVRKDQVYYSFRYTIDMGTTTLYYTNTDGDLVEIKIIGGDISGGEGDFHLMKLVIDSTTLTYQHVRFNEYVYDISGISTFPQDVGLTNMLVIGLKATDTSEDQGIIRFDDLTLTLDEP